VQAKLEEEKNQSNEHAAKTSNRPAMAKIIDRMEPIPMRLGLNVSVHHQVAAASEAGPLPIRCNWLLGVNRDCSSELRGVAALTENR
jgi:hypothetical protein